MDTGLLAAVIANPDDDLPRLVMADALDERGDVRGEFIRLQVAVARRWPRGWTANLPDESDYASHVNRLRDIIYRGQGQSDDAILFEWFPPIGGLVFEQVAGDDIWEVRFDGAITGEAAFRRGFIEEITLSWADWLARHAALYWHPDQPRDCPPGACPIRRVALTSGPVVRWTDATGRNEWCQLAAPDGTPVGDELRADSLADARQLLLARMWPGITFELSARNGLDNHPEFTALRHNRYRVGQSVRFTMHVPGGTPTNPECEVVQVAGPRGGGFPVPARVDGNTVFADYAANAPGTFDVHMRAMANGQRLHTATTFSVADDPFA
jgi:uncharacterized protein (TIGR02996 family)